MGKLARSPAGIVGLFFLIVALVAVARDVLAASITGIWAPEPLGQVWATVLGRGSLVNFQAGVERYITPVLWEPIFTLLLWPAWMVPLGLAALFLLFAWAPWRRDA